MEIEQRYIRHSKYTRPGIIRFQTTNTVWHYTANPGASADNHFTYFDKTMIVQNEKLEREAALLSGQARKAVLDKIRYASANTFIDRHKVLEIIPIDEESYHASQANPHSVGVELCIELDGSFHPDTIRQAVEYGAYLNDKYDLDKSSMLRHYDVTGKLCPLPWVNNPGEWFNFKELVHNFRKNGGSRMPDWKDWQWKMFADALDGLYRASTGGELPHPVLSDYTWAEKAYKRELAVNDVLWLLGIMTARSMGIKV